MSQIVSAIQRYYPDWEPPDDIRVWNKCLCPFHGESNASAAINFDQDAFNCLGCGVSGDAISIIRHEEEVSFAEAKRIAEGLSVGGGAAVPDDNAGKSSRRVPFESGPRAKPRAKSVRTGIRGRSTPWS
jgi:hypothetical protein